MKIIDSYSKLRSSLSVSQAHPVFRAWGYADSDLIHWFRNGVAPETLDFTAQYLANVSEIVVRIEEFFRCDLPGELVLIPSMGEVDGFARYDRGFHTVMLGVDFPDASFDYLRALTAHELSHVYRDHCPNVWSFMGKPLTEISREEYLDATTAREHLVSEGLAVLNSQAVFPDIYANIHHYYDSDEMLWCERNFGKIDQALRRCLKESDPDPWRFYSAGSVAAGCPSHTHYYWAARKISEWLKNDPGIDLLEAHALSAQQINAF